MATLIRNLPTRVRNVLMVDGIMVNVGMLNKTTFTLKQDKLIPRAVPPLVSDIMASYIAFLRPLELILTMAAGQIPKEKAMPTTTHLFHVNGRHFETRDLTNGLIDLSKDKLGVEKGLGTADFRQLSIFIAHKHFGSQVIAEERCALLDLQAGHSSEIARRWYGVEADRLGGQINDAQLKAFMEASSIVHRFHGLLDVGRLGDEPQVSGHPLPGYFPHLTLSFSQSLNAADDKDRQIICPSIPHASVCTPHLVVACDTDALLSEQPIFECQCV